MRRAMLLAAMGVFALAAVSPAGAATYEVGPDKALKSVGDVPWEKLAAGDTVLIYWRAEGYKEKFGIFAEGRADAPVTVKGVPGPNGELPVLDGNGATTRKESNYWNSDRSVIKIGGTNTPPENPMPTYIVIENLDVRGARPPYTFTTFKGEAKTYGASASAIHVERGEHITVRNCRLHDSANGFFVSSTDSAASKDILVEGNYIYDNGLDKSVYQHNNYTAAIGITFQFNRFGPLREGCSGNNLKDRSAGLVVRYNWLEGGNRQLDLVDGEDSRLIREDPAYRATFVYGNILIEPENAGNSQIAHYGGDSRNTPNYRKGTLYFYNNTVVSTRTDRTTLFRLSTNDESCDARNNILYAAAADGKTLSLIDGAGRLTMTHNWLKSGYVKCFETPEGEAADDGTSVTGAAPGFVDEARQDFRLARGSPCIDAGTALAAAALPANNVVMEYEKHRKGGARPADMKLDIGAYEFVAGAESRR